MAVFCAVIAIYDIRAYRIPDFLLVLFCIMHIAIEGNLIYYTIASKLYCACAALIIFSAAWYVTKGLGLGDVKYAAVLSFLLGPENIIPAFFATAFIGMLVFFTGIVIYKWPKTVKIPYAPFLSAGAILTSGGFI